MKHLKILLLAILLASFGLSASAQQVTVNLKQVKLVKVLDVLSEQTGYTFYHSRPAVDPDRIVSLEVTNVKLETALDRLFSGTGINYEISNKKVYLRKAEKTASSQNETAKKVSGTVTDASGTPIIGVGVFIKGTTNGTTTDIDGKWTLSVKPSDTIVFSSIGYTTQEISAGSRSEINVTLEDDALLIEDAVVIGYGTVKKRDVSTAISSIKAEDLANLPNSDFRQAMAGKMPGVTVMQTSGDPEGSNLMVRVRGVRSATAGNDPLYIIDGVPVENGLMNLNPNDV